MAEMQSGMLSKFQVCMCNKCKTKRTRGRYLLFNGLWPIMKSCAGPHKNDKNWEETRMTKIGRGRKINEVRAIEPKRMDYRENIYKYINQYEK